MPVVARFHEARARVETAVHAGLKRGAEVALHVDVAIEIAVEHADVPERRDARFRRTVPEVDRKARRLLAVPVMRPVGIGNLERGRRVGAQLFELASDQRFHFGGSLRHAAHQGGMRIASGEKTRVQS